jgi:hypothetical protein
MQKVKGREVENTEGKEFLPFDRCDERDSPYACTVENYC